MRDKKKGKKKKMDQIQLSEVELLELRRCYHCDCASYPLCTWIGEPCKECFCTETFTHYDPDERHPGQFKTQNAHRPVKRALLHTRVSEIKTSEDGDCLYDCLALAFNRYLLQGVATQPITVSDLRIFASRCQTEATFAAYKVLAESTNDYECISKTRTLRGFKNIVQQCGSDVGSERCLWGDENTLTFFSESYRIRFVVFNERGQLIQIIGSLDYGHTILLRLNRKDVQSEHFTLLQFNNETILQQHEWFWLKRKVQPIP